MHRTASVGLLVAILVVTSGCSALFGSNGATPTPQFTPAPVPTEEPTPTPVPLLAPGLTNHGLTNASALRESHTKFLANTSFTVREVWLLKLPNGSVAARRVVTTRVEGTSVYIVANYTGFPHPISERETWYGENRSFTRTVYNNSISYSRLSREGPSHIEPIPQPGAYFNHVFEPWMNPVVERRSRNGTTFYYLEKSIRDSGSNITISARIDPRGFIRSYTVREPISSPYPVPNASRSVRTIQIIDIGTTTVEQPAWYDEAVNKTTSVNRTTATATTTD